MTNIEIKDFTTVQGINDTDYVLLSLSGGTSGKVIVRLMKEALTKHVSPNIRDGVWWVGETNLEVNAIGKTPVFRKGELGVEYRYDTEADTAWRLLIPYEDIRLKFEDLTEEERDEITLHFSDLTEEEIAVLQQPAADMVALLEETNEQVTEAESLRAAAEKARAEAETQRISAESERMSAEQTRISSENTRLASEEVRVANEEGRIQAESLRVSAENARAVSENERAQAEAERKQNETQRVAAEQERAASETERKQAETDRSSEYAVLRADMQSATDSANDTADHPTYVGEDNYVYKWNKEAQSYDKTAVYVRGEGFSISKVYSSVQEMEADTGHGLKEGDFVLINTGDVENPDNAQIYTVTSSGGFSFLVDMSGAIGFTGKTPQMFAGSVTVGSGKASAAVALTQGEPDADGNPTYNINFVIPCLAYEDLTGEQIAELQKPANDMIAVLTATDESVKAAEAGRVSAEDARVEAETQRIDSESERLSAEEIRSASELQRIASESDRHTAEQERIASEEVRVSSEESRVQAELLREQAKEAMEALSEEISTHPPVIDGDSFWNVWDAVGKAYVNTGIYARGRTPIIIDGIWWLWDDEADDFVNTGVAVNTDFVLTKAGIEAVFVGDITTHTHTHLRYRAQVYEEEPDFNALTTWTDDMGEHEYRIGNDIYVANDTEPTGYANYRLAVTSEGSGWVRIPQIMPGWSIVLVKQE